MELKKYQRAVLGDLKDYLACVAATDDLNLSWQEYWQEKILEVGGKFSDYQNEIAGVPHVCIKVPTGGGKTFMACAALRAIYEKLLRDNPKMVIWLVPSEAILTQTLNALRNSEHPYRAKLDEDFGGKVEVYSKEMLLQAENFSVPGLLGNLSICVMSYASIRIDSKKQDVRKVYNENGALESFANYFESADNSLINILREISPLVVVDESHNAKSDLSVEMLKNLNPSFILELTATPKTTSNIISYVNARDLKAESMVKLPVIVYKKDTRQKVITDAIALRNKLEMQAEENLRNGGKYIRPIVLFQAQPKGKADSATFAEVKKILVRMGIAEKEIAIKTAELDELKGVNLLSPKCAVRYIITVNALKEGWDCPFAYILASLANKNSQVDVEQIVGRILRQPYAEQQGARLLNIGYVFSCYKNFSETIDRIVAAMKFAGFTKNECRQAPIPAAVEEVETAALDLTAEVAAENFSDINVEVAQKEIASGAVADIEVATVQAEEYENLFSTAARGEVVRGENQFEICADYRESVAGLKIPQFFKEVTANLFEHQYVLLEREHLTEKFSLETQDANISFALSPDDLYEIDIRDRGEATPQYKKISGREREHFINYLESLPSQSKIRQCTDAISKIISDNTGLSFGDVKRYVKKIIAAMDEGEISAISRQYPFYASRIQQKIIMLENLYRKKIFSRWLETGEIICQDSYALPETIFAPRHIDSIPKSLYAAEFSDMNRLERRMIEELVTFEGVKWWHRNIPKKEFKVNGFVNHYPDFVVMLESGKVLMIETKGDDRDNSDSREKLELGRKWQARAGLNYRYFMVFDNNKIDADGAYNFNEFLSVVRDL